MKSVQFLINIFILLLLLILITSVNYSQTFPAIGFSGKYYSAGGVNSGNIAKKDGLLTGVSRTNDIIPENYSLDQNYTNPLNNITVIKFSIPIAGNVKLNIFDETGREVSVLVNQNLSAGNYSCNYNAKNLASGAYFYMLVANDNVEVREMVLAK